MISLKMEILFVFLMCLYGYVYGGGNENYTFTYGMAMRCKEYIAQHGYNYDKFYEINQDTLTHATLKKDGSNVTYFEMHIAIQAASNGHILLSAVAFPSSTDTVYEIVVGGGGNKFTELRLNLKRNSRGSSQTPGILSPVTFTAFYIKVSYDGLVEFGREGDSLPLVSYYDANPLPVQYFSFSSWAGVEAKFLYDCPPPGASAGTSDSQAVEPTLSNSDKLKRKILMSKLPSVQPAESVLVTLGIKVLRMTYNAKDFLLTSYLAIYTSWTDDSMAWDPTDYNGTTSILFRQSEIWRPIFFAYNSDRTEPLDGRNPEMISVVNSGDATARYDTEVVTWCADNKNKWNTWPRDEYYCTILIEPWHGTEAIKLDIIPSNDPRVQPFKHINEIPSEWDVHLSGEIVINSNLWSMFHMRNNETHLNDRYFIAAELKRNNPTYSITVYTPILVFSTFILLSFCTERTIQSKIIFYSACMIISTTATFYIAALVPQHKRSSLVELYFAVTASVLTALYVNVFLFTKLADGICNTYISRKILSFWLLRAVFFLPKIKVSRRGRYARQQDEEERDEEENQPSPLQGVQQMETEEVQIYGDKRDLAEILNKLLFIGYIITFACLLLQKKPGILHNKIY